MYKLKELVKIKNVSHQIKLRYCFAWDTMINSCFGKMGKVEDFVYDQGKLVGIKVLFKHINNNYIFRIEDVEKIPSYYLKYIY